MRGAVLRFVVCWVLAACVLWLVLPAAAPQGSGGSGGGMAARALRCRGYSDAAQQKECLHRVMDHLHERAVGQGNAHAHMDAGVGGMLALAALAVAVVVYMVERGWGWHPRRMRWHRGGGGGAVPLQPPMALHAAAPRVPESPYPASCVPTQLYAISDDNLSPSERVTISTLQGLTARTCPVVYRSSTAANPWLDDLKRERGVRVVWTFVSNPHALLTQFAPTYSSYVLADTPTAASVNAALTACAAMDAALVVCASDTEMVALMKALKKTCVWDARGMTVDDVLRDLPRELWSRRVVTVQDPAKSGCMGDYSMFCSAVTQWPASDKSIPLLASMHGNSAVMGWGSSEWDLVSSASKCGMFVNASDWCTNVSVLSNFALTPALYRTRTPAPLLAPRAAAPHYVCFLMTDGDNLQLILNALRSPQWFGSTARGRTHISWSLSPALAELAPTALEWYARNATSSSSGSDTFVAGVSGAGYAYPDEMTEQQVGTFAQLTAALMDKSGMHTLNVLGNQTSAAAAATHLAPMLAHDAVDGVLYFTFPNAYAGLQGEISRAPNGKPVIGARCSMWKGFNTPEQVAAKVNAQPCAPTRASGYSLIPVHLWDYSVDDINKCASLLGPHVQVVPADTFVSLIASHVKP